MKIAFCTIGFQFNKYGKSRPIERPLIDLLPAIALAGFNGVEIWSPHVESLSNGELITLRSRLDELGLSVPMISPYFNFTRDAESAASSIELGQRVIHIARVLNIPAIRCFTGNHGSAEATAEQWSRAADCLQTLADAAAPCRLALEMHSRNLTDTAASIRRLISDIDRKNVGIILHLPGQIDALPDLAPHVIHLHANVGRDGVKCPLADCEAQLKPAMNAVRSQPSLPADLWISDEYFGADPDGAVAVDGPFLQRLLK